MLQKIANTIRHLTMDAVELAGSGHPGMPMGCAELGAYLFGEFLRFDPTYPKWPHRDRLILSVGHGSLWLYSCLHLAGFPITLDDLKNFRQIDSKTPSHPDLTKTEGVEATTGVDGQGVGYAVGQALGLKHLRIDSKVVVVAGDGDLMEGVAMESCSLAGHLRLNNLILIFDSNSTTLDGYVHESFSENLSLRFQSQGWDLISVDGHNLDQIRAVLAPLRTHQEKPTLIIAHTRIGCGAQNTQGTPAAHGKPLGKEEVALAKKALGLPDISFHVDPEIYQFFKKKSLAGCSPLACSVPSHLESILQKISIPSPIAGRWASHAVLQVLADHVPQLDKGATGISQKISRKCRCKTKGEKAAMMKYKGYIGHVEYDDGAKIFHGEVVGFSDIITFQGKSVDELEEAFKDSVDDYLKWCREHGEKPEKTFSGTFNLRIPPRASCKTGVPGKNYGDQSQFLCY